MKKVIVTTSWDDGHRLDMRLARMMRTYGIRGTFYVSPKDREFKPSDRLTEQQIIQLSRDFEIGAHTMTHPKLSLIDDATARREIVDSKKHLEKILGQEVRSFCYPSGDYEEKHKRMVREAGFALGRTVSRFATATGGDRFALPTTVHAYRHWSDAAPIMRHAGWSRFTKQYFHWDELAISFFDTVLANGGVFHLWGHSWEIAANGDWDRLERVFERISSRREVSYISNGALV